MELAIHECLAKPHIADTAATLTIDDPTAKICLTLIFKHEVKKGSIEKAIVEDRFFQIIQATWLEEKMRTTTGPESDDTLYWTLKALKECHWGYEN